MEEFSLDLIIHDDLRLNIKSFSKQNFKLRIHSKPDRNQSKLTVCSEHVIPAALMVFKFGLNYFTDGLIWFPGLSHIGRQYYELQINGRLNFPYSCNSFHIQNTGMVLNLFQHYAFSFYAFGLICGLNMLKRNTRHIHTWLFLYAFLEYAVSTRKVETMWIDTENTGSNWFYIHWAIRVSTFKLAILDFLTIACA